MATRKFPSYCVEIVGHSYGAQAFVTTLYTAKLDPKTKDWWHTRLHEGEAALVE
jgi:hypothetical protein